MNLRNYIYTAGAMALITSTQAAVVLIGANNSINAGGLSNVVTGDNLNFGGGDTNANTAVGGGGMNFSATGNSSTLFTVTEGLNSVTLRMHFNVVGTVNPNKNAGGINSAESITISFDLVSGGLDSFSMSDYTIRDARSATDGTSGEGFTVSDNSSNINTWYSIRGLNSNMDMVGGNTTTISADSTYAAGNPGPGQNGDAGLNVLSESNLATWSWTIAGVDPGAAGGTTSFSFNQIKLNITPSAVPEPSSAALLGLGGLALILRRRK